MRTVPHAGTARNAARRGTSARPTTHQPAALDAAAVHIYGLARGRRVHGAAEEHPSVQGHRDVVRRVRMLLHAG